MIAFWRNDRFPYCLWGTVTKFDEFNNDFVETKEYGVGRFVKPILIVSEDFAKPLIDQLSQLKGDRTREEDELYTRYREKLDKVWHDFYFERGGKNGS